MMYAFTQATLKPPKGLCTKNLVSTSYVVIVLLNFNSSKQKSSITFRPSGSLINYSELGLYSTNFFAKTFTIAASGF